MYLHSLTESVCVCVCVCVSPRKVSVATVLACLNRMGALQRVRVMS